jgi:hypothetical protein
MAAMEKKSLDAPDETRNFAKGRLVLAHVGGVTVGRQTLDPGWKWSECVKPHVGTPSCQVLHTGYMVSGRLRVRMDDGAEQEFGPHDAFVVPPGHDAWTVGNDPVILLDFSGAAQYGKQS